MTPPVQISTQGRIAAYGFSRKVGSGRRLPSVDQAEELVVSRMRGKLHDCRQESEAEAKRQKEELQCKKDGGNRPR